MEPEDAKNETQDESNEAVRQRFETALLDRLMQSKDIQTVLSEYYE